MALCLSGFSVPHKFALGKRWPCIGQTRYHTGLMSGAFNQKRARRKPVINIAPLIDVMFLLLIFFMVSSTFRDKMGIDLDLPQAASAEAAVEDSPTITVSEDDAIYFNEAEFDDIEELRPALEELYARDPEARITLRAGETADFGTAIRALDIARDIGFKQIVVPTRPLETAQEE